MDAADSVRDDFHTARKYIEREAGRTGCGIPCASAEKAVIGHGKFVSAAAREATRDGGGRS